MSKCRVLIDCSELNFENFSGVRTYALGITQALIINDKVKCTVVIKYGNARFLHESISGLSHNQIIELPEINWFVKVLIRACVLVGARKKFLKLKSNYAYKVLRNIDFDLVYVPTTYLNYNFADTKSVVSLHDIQHKDLPKNFSFFERKYRDFRTLASLENASVIHVSSNFVKETIANHYPNVFKESACVVIPEGVDIDRFRTRKSSKNRQLLFPAMPWKHKNHEVLFQALQHLDNEKALKIIVTGASKMDFRKFSDRQDPMIDFRGVVSNDELNELYGSSFAVLSCSNYESSSLPILEGIAAGCLILASDIKAHREMAELFEIILFDQNNSHDLAKKIMTLINIYDSRQLITNRNVDFIRERTWSSISDKLIKGMDC
jgi:glycosyltransferase involved in cell wall biosynthesis